MIYIFWLLASILTGLVIYTLVRLGMGAGADKLARRWLLGTATLIPIAVLVTYFGVGTPALIANQPAKIEMDPATQLEQAIGMLEKKIAEQPEDTQAFALLFRALMTVQRFDQALELVQSQLEARGESATLVAMQGEALAMLAGGTITAQVSTLIDRSLALEPDNFTALWLAGYRAHQKDRHTEAADLFARAAALAVDPQRRDQLAELAQESRNLQASPNPASATFVDVVVTVAPAIQAKVDPAATLFVYAREIDGSPLPIAVAKLAAVVPTTVRLDDAQAMTPGRKLGDFASYEIIARISPSGEAISKAGDLIGTLATVAADKRLVTVAITEVMK